MTWIDKQNMCSAQSIIKVWQNDKVVSCSTLWNWFLKQSRSTHRLNMHVLQGVCWTHFTRTPFSAPLRCHEHVHQTYEDVSWKHVLLKGVRFLKPYLERSWTPCLNRFLEHKYSTFFDRVLGHMPGTHFSAHVFLNHVSLTRFLVTNPKPPHNGSTFLQNGLPSFFLSHL